MKSCCRCKSEFDLYKYKGNIYCFDCLLEELGVAEEKKVYYINYDTMRYFEDFGEVEDYYGINSVEQD